MKVFHDFYARGEFERSLNVTFIALIPKTSRVADLKDFQPISLVSDITKLLPKF